MSTPLWGNRATSGGFSAPSSGGFDNPTPKTSTAYAGKGTAGTGAGNPLLPPGSISINPLDPMGSAGVATQETSNIFTGLKAALFGSDAPGASEQHGGALGDIPLVGAGARLGSEVFANVAGTAAGAVKGGLDVVGGGLEHLDLNNPVETERLRAEYAAIPATSEAKIAAEKGLASGGLIGPAIGHIMSQAVRAHAEELQAEHPNAFAGLLSAPGSVADTITNLFGALGVGQRAVERGIAGAGRPGAGDLNQLQMVMAVGSGKMAWTVGDAGLSPAEKVTYDKVSNGDWTDAEGLDFLASHGAGLHHDAATEIAGTFATDPLNVLAVGASTVARAGATGARLAATGAQTVREVGSAAKLNVLGRTVGQSKEAADIMRVVGKVYQGLDGTAIGRVAKITRTIVDPLHALDLRSFGGARNVDLLSDITPKQVVAAYGDVNHLKVLNRLTDLVPDGSLRAKFVDDLGVYSANVARRVVAVKHRASIMTLESLQGRKPSDVVEEVLGQQKRGILPSITEEANRFRIQYWDTPAKENLANRMEKMYGLKSQDEWLTEFKDMNPDELSLLHAATYGRAQRMLIEATTSMRASGATGPLADKLHKLVLLNRTTLTRLGAEGIITRVTAAADDTEAALIELKAAQELYPELRYIPIDVTDPVGTVEAFTKNLSRKIDSLPAQATHDEIAAMDQPLRDLVEALGGVMPEGSVPVPGAKINGAWNLGFRPNDEFLWGLERTNISEGALKPIGDVWVDHVADAGVGYRAGHEIPVNIAGIPIVGAAVKAVVRPLDYIEAMGRVMTHQVTGAMIGDAAHGKFIALASGQFGEHGVTKSVAEDIWKRLGEIVDAPGSHVVNPRGLSTTSIWQSVRDLIPVEARAGGLDPAHMLGIILDAYDGDTRFIGLTQKFTARAKAVLGKTGSNFAGQVAEDLWPTMKFRMNPIFQMQEKIEPWVLNAQRGVAFSIGTKMSPADERTAYLLKQMLDHSLVRMGDIDQYEYSARVMFEAGTLAKAADPTSKLAKIREAGAAITNVQGVKRINMLRTFRSGLGKELRAQFEAADPGVWDTMFKDAQSKVTYLLSEDDFAVQVMADKMLGSDILVNRLTDAAGKLTGWHANFKAAIQPGTWAAPQNLGELRKLDMDGMAELLQFPMGRDVVAASSADLRRGLASGTLKMDDITRALRVHGADPDYVRRVESALNFQWDGFWQKAAESFGLTKDESAALQDMMAATARARGLNPVEYMSQVWSPNILGGMDGAVGDLGKAVDVMRAGKQIKEPNLAKFAAQVDKAGKAVSTREDFVRQLSAVFSTHLDPSAKRALLMTFRPDLETAVAKGTLKLDMSEIAQMWDSGAEGQLADHILSGLNHAPGTGWDQTQTVAEFRFKYPSQGEVKLYDPDTDKLVATTNDTLGPGLDAQPEEVQGQIVSELDRLRTALPEINVAHLDIRSLSALDGSVAPGSTVGQTFRAGGDSSAIILDEANFGPDWEAKWAKLQADDLAEGGNKTFTDFEFGGRIQRRSYPGVSFSADPSMLGTVRHEYGHVVYRYIARRQSGGKDRFGALRSFFSRFEESPASFQMSEYSTRSGESAPELLSLALDPEADLSRFTAKAPKINPDDMPLAADLRDVPENMRPGYAGVKGAPKTVEQAVSEVRQLLLDSGLMKSPEVDPNIIGATRMFSKWSSGAVHQGLFGANPPAAISDVLTKIARIPTDGAVPYNATEAMLMDSVMQSMQSKWKDAYRLQYFAQSRTMLERSINHPMFGIYPASYMWGKLGPEMVRFIAKEPFGVRTGAMAMSMLDVQKAVAMRREYDPTFDAAIEKAGHSQALSWLGYMLPTLPWDISSSYPVWARDLAQQGLDNNLRVQQGGDPNQIDIVKPVTDTAKKLNPFEMTAPWAARAVKEVNTALGIGKPAQPAAPQAGSGSAAPAINEPIQGADLGPTLEQQMADLRAILGS